MSQTATKNAKQRGGKQFTARKILIPPFNAAPLLPPEFTRLPKPKTRCQLSGLSRTSILEYGEAGCFKLIRLRKRGAARGVVLVDTASFLRWLHAQPAVTKGAQT